VECPWRNQSCFPVWLPRFRTQPPRPRSKPFFSSLPFAPGWLRRQSSNERPRLIRHGVALGFGEGIDLGRRIHAFLAAQQSLNREQLDSRIILPELRLVAACVYRFVAHRFGKLTASRTTALLLWRMICAAGIPDWAVGA